jgi:subtilisin-like proprotein convertase family protein
MDPEDYGRFLPRHGQTIPLAKAKDAFTALVSRPENIVELLGQQVADITPVTNSIVRVRVRPVAEATIEEQRDQLMQQLRDRQALVVHHEYLQADVPSSRYQITDEIIIKFRPNVDSDRIGAILETAGVVIKKQYMHLGQTYLVKVTSAANANPVKVANRLESLEEVEHAEPSLINPFVQFAFPRDEMFAAQWHLYSKALGAPDIDPLADASVYEAWQITKGSRDVIVAVLDDGFELTHPDFQGPHKIVNPVDFTGQDTMPLPESTDYHGTPCAGVAIAEENGYGCVGVAPACAFMPVRFPLHAADPWLIEIFQYVSHHAHIASCSWGLSPGNFPLHSSVAEMLSQVVRVGGKDGKGLTIVFAAGNYDAPIDATVDYPIRWLGTNAAGQQQLFEATGRLVNGFAADPNVIAVGACTSMNRKSLYSNWGLPISVVAPSDNFNPVTLTPLLGRAITTTDNEQFALGFTPGKRYTNSFGGTSSATPLVAGVAALVKSANPQLSALQIKAILEQTASKIEDDVPDVLYGHNSGNYIDGYSEWFGHGKVNAFLAVQKAVGDPAHTWHATYENNLSIAIPDYPGEGVKSIIKVVEQGWIADVVVAIDIDHTWIGDLQIYLQSPFGMRVLLHDRHGFNLQNIHHHYTRTNAPQLEALRYQQAQGRWVLIVVDQCRGDVGVLNNWGLDFKFIELQIDRSSLPEMRIDDFTTIRGVGPYFAAKLIDSGIISFSQLADLTDLELDAILQPQKFQRPNYKQWRTSAVQQSKISTLLG